MRKNWGKYFGYVAAAMLVLGTGACGKKGEAEISNPTVAVTPDPEPTGAGGEGEKEPSVTPDTKEEKEGTITPEGIKSPDGKEPTDGADNPSEITYTKLSVTEDMITSSAPWNNGPDVAANAFDGDVSTFFDGLEEGFIRVDLGDHQLIKKISYAPR
ncbi:MAG: discoidin domain-containing protein, partial [Lachnospiraceae bacterium]|nr:discoidin domain-containing protein [Lachnospiraceae bacterium]